MFTNEILELDPQTSTMKNMTPWHKPPSLLKPRSHFSSLLIGHEFLCLGGIGKFGCALADFIKVDL